MQSIFSFCCVSRSQDAKQTPGFTPDVLSISETNGVAPIKRPLSATRSQTNQILHRFKLIEDEIMMGLAHIDLVQLCDSLVNESIEDTTRISQKSRQEHTKRVIPRASVMQIFKSTPQIKLTPILLKCLQLDYFFTQGSKDYYDFEKLVTFCLLYTKSTSSQIKNELLFELMANGQSQRIEYGSKSIPRLLEIIVTITCFLIAHFLRNNIDVLSSTDEQDDFEELFNIFIQSESNGTLSDFTLHTRNTTLFPLNSRGAGKSNAITRDIFTQQQRQKDFPLVQSDCVREMFVEFVQTKKSVGQKLGQTGRTDLISAKHNIPKNGTGESPASNKSITTSSIRGQITQIDRESERSFLALEAQHQQQLIRFNNKKPKKANRKEVSEDSKKDQDFFQVPTAAQSKLLQQSQNYIVEPILEQNQDEFELKRKPRSKQKRAPAQSEQSVEFVAQSEIKRIDKTPVVLPHSLVERVEKIQKQKKAEPNLKSNFCRSIPHNEPDNEVEFYPKGNKSNSRKKQEPVVKSDNYSQLGSNQSSKESKAKTNHSLDSEQLKARQSVLSVMRGTRATIQKRVVDVETHLCEVFGEQFYQMVYLLLLENQADFEEDNQISDADHKNNRQLLKIRAERFKKNRKIIGNRSGFKLVFPNSKGLNPVVRDILEIFKHTITAEDIVALQNGTLFSENFLNLYFKILEKINSVLLTAQIFAQQTQTLEHDTTCEKVMYCGSQYIKTLRKTPLLSQIKASSQLSYDVGKVYDYDVVLVPFFFNEQNARQTEKSIEKSPKQFDDTGAVIVAIQTNSMKIDLFDRGTRDTILSDVSETKNQMISEEILNLLENAASLTTKNGVVFNEDAVDGGVESVSVECEEDYLIAMMYIAECFTFNRAVDLETFNLERERNKIVDVLLTLLKFQ